MTVSYHTHFFIHYLSFLILPFQCSLSSHIIKFRALDVFYSWAYSDKSSNVFPCDLKVTCSSSIFPPFSVSGCVKMEI